MSDPGTSFNPMELMFPIQSQQQRKLSRNQAYANMLLSSAPAQGAYGGLATAGRELAGAFLSKNTSDQQMGVAQQYANAFQNMMQPQGSQERPPSQSSGQISNSTDAPTPPASQQPSNLSFDDFYNNYLSKQEGGYNKNDGNGSPVNYGINQKNNPGVGVANLTQPQAAQIMRQKYWDQSGAATLPPALAAIHADTAINMGGTTANQLLQASGGDPNTYMQLRAQKYQQIAQNNPHMAQYLPAWSNRLQALGQYASSLQGAPQTPQGSAATPQGEAPAPQGAGPFGLPGLSGFSPGQNMMSFALNAPEYMKNIMASTVPTEVEKNFTSAYGKDTPQYRNAMQAYAIKQGSTAGRPGGFIFNAALPNGGVGIPNTTGLTPTMQPNGQMGMTNAPGSLPAVANTNYASTMGTNAATPAVGFVNGQPVMTNKAAMTGNGAVPGNPLAPPTPPAPSAAAPSGSPNRAAQGPLGGGAMLPQLPPGQDKFMDDIADEAGTRHAANIAAAQEAPMRINVLQNMLNLSQNGIATGPGQDWQNHLLGLISNIPGASMLMGGVQRPIANYQELKKFTLQQGVRAWQAVGGTGTDNQLERLSEANPNTEMFPSAIQAISKWTMAGEKAVMAKANAQDAYLGQNGSTPQSQIAFEGAWRNAFDQNAFRLSTMAQPEATQFLKSLSPQERNSLVSSRQKLMQLGVSPSSLMWTQ